MNNSHDPLTVLHGDELPVQPDPAIRGPAAVTPGIGAESLGPNRIEQKELS